MHDARKKHEKAIKEFNSGAEFDRALTNVMRRFHGLDFFNDAQIAMLREEMVQAAWDSRKRMRKFRRATNA